MRWGFEAVTDNMVLPTLSPPCTCAWMCPFLSATKWILWTVLKVEIFYRSTSWIQWMDGHDAIRERSIAVRICA